MKDCPECSGSKIVLAGNRYVRGQKIQRYLCKICGHRFSEKSDINRIQQTRSSQICVSLIQEAKNLAAKQPKEVLQETNTKESLFNFSWWLIKNGRAEQTAKSYTGILKVLAQKSDLKDTEKIKSVIAKHFKNIGTKRNATNAYNSYLKYMGGTWEKPVYRPPHKQAFIPTDEELQLAINCGTKESMVFTLFCYETGCRKNEAQRLEWTDLDKDRGLVKVKSSKHCYERTLPISDYLMNLLFSFPKEAQTVFSQSSGRSQSFHNRMKNLAKKHDNPRFLKIHLHTFRHCKALREYHRTRDVLDVMETLGHRKLETTHEYVRLYKQIYKNSRKKQFVTKIASTKEERLALKNEGWDCWEKDGEDWYFSKPK